MSKVKRPNFNQLHAAYPKGSAEDVFKLIGGKVEANNFANSCAMRVSRSLNYSGYKIDYIPPNLTVSGSDGNWYIYRVAELIKYLNAKFGDPDIVIKKGPYQPKFKNKKGIIIFEVDEWSDASGHATLWDGVTCSDKCYFPLSKKVMLWELN
jgi:hypothetical protein